MFGSLVASVGGALVGLGGVVAAPAAARSMSQAQQPCEIHAWPAPPMQMLSEGLLLNHKVDQQLAPVRHLYPAGSSPLDTARQVALLRAADLTRLFNRPGSVVTVHDEVVARRQPGAQHGRRTPSTAPCYAELTIGRVFYTKNAMSRGSLRVLFSVDDYAAAPTPRFAFSSFGDADLKLFPPATAAAAASADAELSDAFTNAFNHFAARASVRKTETR